MKKLLVYLLLVVLLPLSSAVGEDPPGSRGLLGKKIGELEIQQLLLDRPLMKDEVHPKNEMYIWIAERFGGVGGKPRILWDSSPTYSGQYSECIPCRGAHTGPSVVRILAKGLSGRDQWCLVLFEIENINRSQEIQTLYAKIGVNGLSSDEFVLQYAKLEHKTLTVTSERLKQWKPFKDSRSSEQERWILSVPNSFEEYWTSFKDKGAENYIRYLKKTFHETEILNGRRQPKEQ